MCLSSKLLRTLHSCYIQLLRVTTVPALAFGVQHSFRQFLCDTIYTVWGQFIFKIIEITEINFSSLPSSAAYCTTFSYQKMPPVCLDVFELQDRLDWDWSVYRTETGLYRAASFDRQCRGCMVERCGSELSWFVNSRRQSTTSTSTRGRNATPTGITCTTCVWPTCFVTPSAVVLRHWLARNSSTEFSPQVTHFIILSSYYARN